MPGQLLYATQVIFVCLYDDSQALINSIVCWLFSVGVLVKDAYLCMHKSLIHLWARSYDCNVT